MPSSFGYRGELTCAMGVSNLKKAIAWYKEMLGFEVTFEIPEQGWCEVATSIPGVSIGFSEVEKPAVVGGATLVFSVDNVEKAKAELEKKGVRFDGEIMEIPGMVKLATFFDNDGHKFMFSQCLMAAAH